MSQEIQALMDHNTWTVFDPSEVKQKLIDCKWVFKVKPETRATKKRHKASWVAKGFQQRRGVYFNETYAPTTKLSLIPLPLAHARTYRLAVGQADIESAFLNGRLDEKMYMRRPKGFVDNRRPNYACKLERTLYGLKQASRGF